MNQIESGAAQIGDTRSERCDISQISVKNNRLNKTTRPGLTLYVEALKKAKSLKRQLTFLAKKKRRLDKDSQLHVTKDCIADKEMIGQAKHFRDAYSLLQYLAAAK
ncbi:hypothetical protein KIN20_017366 [Parelaphostrongylus tenuis]|uniref:Uncharacterized protein n=1 Tax=Parelaphostrongylus tenuis TaxID=148309 RepID=A0AAD5MIG6_PARTN|nr:hypothetical protein KIN20_017366 [Parelaphostrongylus tenuis]